MGQVGKRGNVVLAGNEGLEAREGRHFEGRDLVLRDRQELHQGGKSMRLHCSDSQQEVDLDAGTLQGEKEAVLLFLS